MSSENVDVVRGAFQRWLDRGAAPEAFPADALDPNIEWDISAHPLPDWPDRGRGREALLRNLAVYLSGWRGYVSEIREVVDAGDDVMVVLHESAQMPDSGAVLDRELIQIWTFRNARAVKLRVFKTRREGLEAVGGVE